MEPTPSLREVFAALAGGSANPAEALHAAGYGDLPGELVAEAIVSYADAAPVEVAEHLSGFVTAHSAVPQQEEAPHPVPDTPDGLDLLASAPTDVTPPDGTLSDGVPSDVPSDVPFDTAPHETAWHDSPAHDLGGHDLGGHDLGTHDLGTHDLGGHDPADLFFGAGQPAAPAEHGTDPGLHGPGPHEPGLPDAGAHFDPAVLAPGVHDPSWLDVSSPLGGHDDADWSGHHPGAADAGHGTLDPVLDHDQAGDHTLPDDPGA